jgi:hypothetical protein
MFIPLVCHARAWSVVGCFEIANLEVPGAGTLSRLILAVTLTPDGQTAANGFVGWRRVTVHVLTRAKRALQTGERAISISISFEHQALVTATGGVPVKAGEVGALMAS